MIIVPSGGGNDGRNLFRPTNKVVMTPSQQETNTKRSKIGLTTAVTLLVFIVKDAQRIGF